MTLFARLRARLRRRSGGRAAGPRVLLPGPGSGRSVPGGNACGADQACLADVRERAEALRVVRAGRRRR